MKIKKIFICFIAMLICLSVTGCQFKYKYKLSQSSDEIVKIEIIFVDEGEIIIKKELSTEEGNSLLSEILDLTCYKYWNDPNSTIGGEAVVISYSNGNYEIISVYSSQYFIGERRILGPEYFDEEPFRSIIRRYIDQEQKETEPPIYYDAYSLINLAN